MINKSINELKKEFLQHLLDGNRQRCSALAKQYLSQNPSIKDLYEEIFKEALYEVGTLWEMNKITVATEHLATAITEGILNELYEELNTEESINNKVVLACVENEMHQVGIKMVADVFEMHGWESYYLGTGIPVLELVEYLKQVKPKILAISLSVFFNFKNLLNMINILKQEFTDLEIIVGGQAFTHIEKDDLSRIDGIKYISNLYDLDKYLKQFKTKPNDKRSIIKISKGDKTS